MADEKQTRESSQTRKDAVNNPRRTLCPKWGYCKAKKHCPLYREPVCIPESGCCARFPLSRPLAKNTVQILREAQKQEAEEYKTLAEEVSKALWSGQIRQALEKSNPILTEEVRDWIVEAVKGKLAILGVS